MARFDVTIVVIVQFVGDGADVFTKEIFDAIDLSSNIRYAFLCIDKDNSCKIEIFHNRKKQKEVELEDKDFYDTDPEKGALPIFLREYVLTDDKEPVISDRYMMFTIGHGAGFGIMTKPGVINKINMAAARNGFVKSNLFIEEIASVQEDQNHLLEILANSFKSNKYKIKRLTSYDFLKRSNTGFARKNRHLIAEKKKDNLSSPDVNYLTSFQFALIIEREFSEAKRKYNFAYNDNIPFDLILHVNCYMQTIENGYALRKVAKYLCATEVGFPTYGISYKMVFKAIAGNPTLDIETTCFDVIKEAFYTRRQTAITSAYGDRGKVALSLNRLSEYKLVYDQLSKMSVVFDKAFENKLGKRSLCCHVYQVREDGRFGNFKGPQLDDKLSFLDITNFLSDLVDDIKDYWTPELQIAIEELMKLCKRAKAAIPFATYEVGSPFYPTSLAIFFPRRNRSLPEDDEFQLQQILKFYSDNEFSKCQFWDEFLKRYLDEKLSLDKKCNQKVKDADTF
ncbi:hypothetical protein SAMN05428949_5871 [Chitinophaga sp. YR627]|uniref:clostripain-related cysteine peptidase n=1 Tax=Chitinophaga sp. YR627 TaxID=1881041 RepID=UPI0008DF3F75|nr:clostripain-related cysteine peptidase [Chitinophaga sp. YR627]SFO58375.1 hypothetical protein SAMN05428949_5871 [Chitinophaga sp. YR627]